MHESAMVTSPTRIPPSQRHKPVQRRRPSSTAALRFNPRSFARFIAEPLNARLNSSCDISNSSRASACASFPAIASRAANAGSFSACE